MALPRSRRRAHLAKEYKIDVAKLDLPALILLPDDGTVAAQQSFAPAGDPPKLNIEALRGFVKRHALPVRNAQEQLRAAVSRARDEKKRVLVQQSGTDSYPSRLLTRFIDEHRELFDRDYVHVNLNAYRMTNGEAVIKELRKAGAATVPWMAILNSDGVKLADSDSPAGNISFPAEPEAINYFIDKMLAPTVQRLTAKELDALRSALGDKKGESRLAR